MSGERPGPELVLVNGTAQTAISPHDRGLHFGDGLFETIACRRGRPRFLTLHLERLARGCARLGISLSPEEELRAEVAAVARERDSALVKVLVTRGRALTRGYAPVGTEKATRITIRYAWPEEDPAWARDGIRVRTARLRLGENPDLAGLKHCNRLEQVLARRECADPGVAEGLLYSSSGSLVSGTMSNVFLVEAARLRTPRLDRCGVEGIMRRVVLREAAALAVEAEVRELGCADLERADEIFLTNARIGIWPVRELDARTFRVGPVTQRLQQHLAPLLAEPADA